MAEQGQIQHIGFGGIDQRGLLGAEGGGDQMLLDGVGVDAVVDFGKVAANVPAQRFSLIFLEALELFDEVELELYRHPGCELEGDVLMGVGAAVSSGDCPQADGTGFVHPLLDAQAIAVQSGLASNYGEFAIIEIGVEHALPDAQKFDGVAVSQPVGDEKIAVLGLQHVGQGDIVACGTRQDGDFRSLDGDGRFLFFAHCGFFQDMNWLQET